MRPKGTRSVVVRGAVYSHVQVYSVSRTEVTTPEVPVDGGQLMLCQGCGGAWGDAGWSSFAIARKLCQQAAVVAPVIRSTCPSTALICLRLQRAIIGLRDAMAPASDWPDQRQAIRLG